MNVAANDLRLCRQDLASDCRMHGGDLLGENGLETAVILSLFCDARARDDDIIPDGTNNRRGWWADTIAPLAATGLNRGEDGPARRDRLGSRLWLLCREKQLPDVLRRAEDYAREALQWLLDDGEATAVSVTPSIPAQGQLALDIRIVLPDGSEYRQDFQYHYI